MMNEDLGRFMSEDEKRQMNEIIGRAMQRKERGKEEGTHFMALHCQFEQYTHGSDCFTESSDDAVKELLREICMKCCEHGCCHFIGNTEEEEDLPFPKESDEEKNKAEIKKGFQSGRMEMLFSLVHANKISFEEAMSISGLDYDEACDMYEGYKIAKEME